MPRKFRQGDIVFYRAEHTRELVSAKVIGRVGRGYRKIKIQNRFVITNGAAAGGFLGHEYTVDPAALIIPQRATAPSSLLKGRLKRGLKLAQTSTAHGGVSAVTSTTINTPDTTTTKKGSKVK